MASDHETFMRIALQEAIRGGTEGNVAVGSVIVRGETTIGVGRNLVVSTGDPTAHAEIVAIREASRSVVRGDLSNCVLYSTIECCPMCCGAAMMSGIQLLVIGARHQPAEFAVHRLGSYTVESLVRLAGWDEQLQIVTGVLGSECLDVRREWEVRNRVRG
jgi:tRNA(adenine34) deaminase